MYIGVTERGDAGRDLSWLSKQDQMDGLILISKDPGSIPIEKITKPFVIHCTITGYGGSVIEPNVKKPEVVLAIYDQLLDRFGGDKIVLRVDPIILDFPHDKPQNVINRCGGRLRISFFDGYRHSIDRFAQMGIRLPKGPFHYPLADRQAFLNNCPDAEICAEPNMPCTGCISAKDLKIMGLPLTDGKLAGQRPLCRCLAVKTELLTQRRPCPHGCLYCYWK